MMGRGALLVEGERELILQFLAKNYGPPPAKIGINEASVEQLMSTFGLSQSEAEAVIRYKQQQGVILGWEDLRKIPNLDVSKFETKRELLGFL
jgi:DNA uptake protein ComE-like DNA-binding protein